MVIDVDRARPSLGEAGRSRVPIGYRVGPWEITEPIATGGWGAVYAARRTGGDLPGDQDDEAALKFLPGGRLTAQQQLALADSAAREAAWLSRVRHPRLLRPFATYVVEDPDRPELHGSVVLAMERAARSLREVLRAAAGAPVPEAERMLAELCEALAEVHRSGWVHGDVKPSNVLLMADGSVRLADFGLSGELEGTHAYVPLLGSEDYLPPEWWTERVSPSGVPARPSRDVWAFGVLAHQLLSGGEHPFPGASPRARTASAHTYAQGRAELRVSEAVPEPWRPLVRDCLAPTHVARARHTTDELLARIGAAASAAPTGRPRPRVSRAAVGVLAVALAGGGAGRRLRRLAPVLAAAGRAGGHAVRALNGAPPRAQAHASGVSGYVAEPATSR